MIASIATTGQNHFRLVSGTLGAGGGIWIGSPAGGGIGDGYCVGGVCVDTASPSWLALGLTAWPAAALIWSHYIGAGKRPIPGSVKQTSAERMAPLSTVAGSTAPCSVPPFAATTWRLAVSSGRRLARRSRASRRPSRHRRSSSLLCPRDGSGANWLICQPWQRQSVQSHLAPSLSSGSRCARDHSNHSQTQPYREYAYLKEPSRVDLRCP